MALWKYLNLVGCHCLSCLELNFDWYDGNKHSSLHVMFFLCGYVWSTSVELVSYKPTPLNVLLGMVCYEWINVTTTVISSDRSLCRYLCIYVLHISSAWWLLCTAIRKAAKVKWVPCQKVTCLPYW